MLLPKSLQNEDEAATLSRALGLSPEAKSGSQPETLNPNPKRPRNPHPRRPKPKACNFRILFRSFPGLLSIGVEALRTGAPEKGTWGLRGWVGYVIAQSQSGTLRTIMVHWDYD